MSLFDSQTDFSTKSNLFKTRARERATERDLTRYATAIQCSTRTSNDSRVYFIFRENLSVRVTDTILSGI